MKDYDAERVAMDHRIGRSAIIRFMAAMRIARDAAEMVRSEWVERTMYLATVEEMTLDMESMTKFLRRNENGEWEPIS